MKTRIGPTNNRCYICQKPLTQPAKGRLRLTCSNACRQARHRSLHGKTSREDKRRQKLVEKRRGRPFGERVFNPRRFEPVLTLSYGRKLYECMSCGKPYLVERIGRSERTRSYCSGACEMRARRRWDKFLDAFEKAHQQGRGNRDVEERFAALKLSPLCPVCGVPFPPNTTLQGDRKRGRPRKYCSEACRKARYEGRWKTDHGGARRHRWGECAECGARFERTNSAGRRVKRFCSELCGKRYHGRIDARRRRERQKAAAQN